MGLHHRRRDRFHPRYTSRGSYILEGSMGKHLVDIDEQALGAARAELGTSTIKDTVNEALKRAGAGRDDRVAEALDILAAGPLVDRSEAWH